MNIELFAQTDIAEVVKAIAPNRKGRIKFRASFWPAKLYTNSAVALQPSEQVVVVGRDGITLLVTPIPATQIA